MPELTHQRLLQLLHYDPETGAFTWLGPRRGRGARHEHAGAKREGGYIVIGIRGRIYRANRLAWFYMTGRWPLNEVGYRDGNSGNNCWTNLRDVPHVLNAQNKKRPSGIEYRPDRPKPYRVRVNVDGKLRTVGSFLTKQEAQVAREAAKCAWHPGYVPILPGSSLASD